MTLRPDIDGSEPVRPEPIVRLAKTQERRQAACSWRLGAGTLACPLCDAPVAVAGQLSPVDLIACPFCEHTEALRGFLSLSTPSRPARVEVHVVHRGRPALR